MLSPDDVVRAGLVHTADKYFWGLIASTLVLFVGAIGEYWEPLEKLHTHDVNTRTQVRTPRKWVIRSQTEWKRLAVLFVVLGIAGEGIFEYLGAKAESAVRNFDNGVAVAAGNAAHDARVDADKAKGDATDAHDLAKSAADIAAAAEGKATTASDKSDRETAKREELGSKIEERSLTEPQQKAIGAACAAMYRYGGSKRIEVRSYGMDKEGADLVKDISDALNSAQLYTSLNTGDIQTGILDTGVLIFGPPEDAAFTSCLGKALTDIGKLTEVSVNGESHMGGAKSSGTVTMSGTTKLTGSSTVIPSGFRPAGSQVDILVGRRPTKIKK